MCNRKDVIREYLCKTFAGHPKLSNATNRNILKSCVQNVYGNEVVLFCIDVEAFEYDNSRITEIGVSVYDPTAQKQAMVPSIMNFHIRPQENIECKNGRFVPDNSGAFAGLASHIMCMDDTVVFLQYLMDKYFKNHPLPCWLVGHNLRGDVKWLHSMGLDFPKCATLDTQLLCSFSLQEKRSLKHCLQALDIPHAHLHNAGNDAYYTLLLALKASDPHARELYKLDTLYPYPVNKIKGKKGDCAQIEVNDTKLMDHLLEQVDRGYNFNLEVFSTLKISEEVEVLEQETAKISV